MNTVTCVYGAYFDHITAFKASYHWTSVKGGAHTHFIDSFASTKHTWAPPLTEVQRYSSDVIKICGGIILDFYIGLSHISTRVSFWQCTLIYNSYNNLHYANSASVIFNICILSLLTDCMSAKSTLRQLRTSETRCLLFVLISLREGISTIMIFAGIWLVSGTQ